MVAPALIAAGAGAGLGLLKQHEQERQFREQAKLAAMQTELSPFSDEISPGTLGAKPSLFQNVLAGGLAGAGVLAQNPSIFDMVTQAQAQPEAEQPQAQPAAAPAPQDPNILESQFDFVTEGFVGPVGPGPEGPPEPQRRVPPSAGGRLENPRAL